jgi:hypothetical protein
MGHSGPFVTSSSPSPLVIHHPVHNNSEYSFQTSPAGQVTVDLPSISQTQQSSASQDQEGVLLCNLDDLSRYIPENFYSDFTLSSEVQQPQLPDYLQTVVAGKAVTTTVNSNNSQFGHQAPQAHGQTVQSPQNNQTIIHLPTQPQPIQGVKTVTYKSAMNGSSQLTLQQAGSAHAQQLTNQNGGHKITQYAYTPSGERIAITGLSPEATKPGSTVQVQVKGGGYQTLQLTPIDPNAEHKLAASSPDTIHHILEDMKHDQHMDSAEMTEYATAIPVAVTSDPARKTTAIKRVAGALTSTVFLPAQNSNNNNNGGQNQNKQTRLIFAGNTLPQGAIPIQINGLNTIPITAVKSIPLNTVISSPPGGLNSGQNNNNQPNSGQNQPKQAKSGGKKTSSSPMQPNQPQKTSKFLAQSSNLANINKAIGNNKTCNWVFENGEVCGKTFSKSYNLVVHMRMHEDVRPFGCSLCDQTFRQKAHLQRHETTHGIGVKISNNNRVNNTGINPPAAAGARRKRKRSNNANKNENGMSANLQQRLARVSEQFAEKGQKDLEDQNEDRSPEAKIRRCSDSNPDPNATFQPFIATPEEAAALEQDNNVGHQGHRTPHDLDAAVTAAVNDAISDIQGSIM